MKTVLLAAAAVFGLSGAAGAASIADRFSAFYSFGDSLSDDGKFSQLDPPSVGGRFTNGRVWAEWIAEDFAAIGKDTGNLAIGGAVAADPDPNPLVPLTTFASQVATFGNALSSGIGLPTRILPVPGQKSSAPAPGNNPLLSVWFGANDLFAGLNPVTAADAVATNIRALNALAPAVFDDFLVVALPDMGKAPAFSGADALAASQASGLFNLRLAQNIAALRAEGLTILGFDPAETLRKIYDDIENNGGARYGILDANTPCTIRMGAALDPTFSNPGSCLDLGIDPDTLLFADAVHPNAVAHRLFAEDLEAAFGDDVSPVPLPAGLPLLLSALAGLGALAGRRRAAHRPA